MNYPAAFLKRLNTKLGDEANTLLDALQNTAPVVSIRTHPTKGKDIFKEEEQIPWCEFGHYLPQRPQYVFDPLYHAGAYYSQEASSMIFPNAIDFSKPLKVLDMCAAPGGKSSLIQSFLKPGSLLVSNEIVGKRASILYENLVKWGTPNCIITNNRPKDFLPLKGYFDVVVVDAPCSGGGMFRKDPDVVQTWNEGMVAGCTFLQKEILETAVQLVKDGGLLIYSTCTFETEENEGILKWLFENYPDKLTPATFTPDESWGLTKVEVGTQAGYYCFPHKVKGEGQFIAAMQVHGGHNSGKNNKKNFILLNPKEEGIIKPFVETNDAISFYRNENNIVGIPAGLVEDFNLFANLTHIKKAGLEVGELNRDVFIPAHELAMATMASASIPRIDLELETAINYQQKKTLLPAPSTEKGWMIYTYKKCDLGWAKNLGNRINNHYPAEWRIRKEL
ncbi:MAG: hypothetical protein NTX03_02250 [Bacteroidetes bacterium]|nr:hypothetical protein [Bacteroidota bacterium]